MKAENKIKYLSLRRRKLILNIRDLLNKPVIRGSLVKVYISCGRKNCKCQRGIKHLAYYLSSKKKTKTRLVYIPKEFLKDIRESIRIYKVLKDRLEDLYKLNKEIFLARKELIKRGRRQKYAKKAQ